MLFFVSQHAFLSGKRLGQTLLRNDRTPNRPWCWRGNCSASLADSERSLCNRLPWGKGSIWRPGQTVLLNLWVDQPVTWNRSRGKEIVIDAKSQFRIVTAEYANSAEGGILFISEPPA